MSVVSNLLDESLASSDGDSRVSSRFFLVEDCVETSGAFVLHHLLKRALSHPVVFLALSQPFSHYDRVLRKLGYNLSMQRKSNNLHFVDMVNFKQQGAGEYGLMKLFDDIQKYIGSSADHNSKCLTIMIDDLSLLEIAVDGSASHILDFLHYCTTLTSDMACSIVVLSHVDIYSRNETPRMLSHLEYLADVTIRAEPLSTGVAADVHGQLTVINKGNGSDCSYGKGRVQNFQFKVKENGVDYFYPGRHV